MSEALNVFAHPSAAHTRNSDSGLLKVGQFDALFLDYDVTALSGTNPTIKFTLERIDAAGVPHVLWTDASALDDVASVSKVIGIGQGIDAPLGAQCRLSWVLGGTNPNVTFSASIVGQ